MQEAVAEVKRLKGCINNLVSVLAMPATWAGGDENQVVTALLDTLVGMLRLDFVYIRLNADAANAGTEMMRLAQAGDRYRLAAVINGILDVSLKCETQTWPSQFPISCTEGEISVVAFRLGLYAELGVFAAGSGRSGFPDANERMLLNVAATQATIGLMETRNRKRPEVALRRSQFYLSEGERLTHAGSWAFNAAGFFDHWSEELFRIYGLDPDKGAPTLEQYLGTMHPQDRESMAETIRKMHAESCGCDVKKRIVRPDGEVRLIRCVGIPVMENGILKGFLGTAMDVTEQEQLTQELRRREAYLAEAQRLSQTGSFGWKPATGEIAWSDETHRIFELNRATKPTIDFILSRAHPEDRAAIQHLADRATREATDWDLEHRLLMPDGTVKYLRVVAHVVHDKASGVTEYVGAVMDVTQDKQAEERIRQSESELRQLIDSIPQHVFVLDEAGRPLQENQMALDYAGCSLQDVQGAETEERIARDIHPDDEERVRAAVRKGLSSGASFEIERRARARDGRYRWFLYRYKPIVDQAARIARWLLTATDIEERKQTEEEIRNENIALREEVVKTSMFEQIVGSSRALHDVLARVAKVAPTESTVLVTGETGTGKELVARAIHRLSPRASRAFVSVNCAAIPRDLIASELFGHEKGAFTGALQRRLGRFELAEGGTIFLDEVGELTAETQLAFLRVLQEREFERVGGTRTIHANVRVIAATNRELEAAIAAGAFRRDLFYRLNVVPILVPPLRERREDIPLLVEYFIDRYARRAGRRQKRIQKKTLELLQRYSWPGNIRELQNVLERSVIISDTENLTVDESWLCTDPPQTFRSDQPLKRAPFAEEAEIIEKALAECRGRVSGVSGAAAKLGIPASTLESKIRSLGINKYSFKV